MLYSYTLPPQKRGFGRFASKTNHLQENGPSPSKAMPKNERIRTMLLGLRAAVRACNQTTADCLQGEIENYVASLLPAFPDLDGVLTAFLAAEPGQARDLARDVLKASVRATRDHARDLSRELMAARDATGVAQRATAEHGARAGRLAAELTETEAELNRKNQALCETEDRLSGLMAERDRLADQLAECQCDLAAMRTRAEAADANSHAIAGKLERVIARAREFRNDAADLRVAVGDYMDRLDAIRTALEEQA